MKKIPTIFYRDLLNPRNIINDYPGEVEWVFRREGVATRKFDGTCVMIDKQGKAWSRREVKPGREEPVGFVAVETDPNTGKTVGWEPVELSGFRKFFAEAYAAVDYNLPAGTYELCGPKINGNPEGFARHVLVPHGNEKLYGVPRTFHDLGVWLHDHPYEGVVWHHPDGRMAKIKKKDFPRP